MIRADDNEIFDGAKTIKACLRPIKKRKGRALDKLQAPPKFSYPRMQESQWEAAIFSSGGPRR
jgi:hypothetical protein